MDIRARIANINCDTDLNMKQYDFKLVVAFILLAYSVAFYLAREYSIIENKTAGVGVITLKEGTCKTVVKL